MNLASEPLSPHRLDSLAADDRRIARLARSLIHDPGRADDVAQDVRFALWRRPPPGGRDLGGLLGTIVARFAANRGREDGRRARRERAAARPENATLAVAEVVEREESRRRLLGAIDRLDEPLRAALLLRWFDDRPPREIARLLKVPIDTVKSRLKRAHARLREVLERDFGGRDAWVSAMLPLARAGVPAVVAVLGGGATPILLGIAAAMLLAALGWTAFAIVCGSDARATEAPAPTERAGASGGGNDPTDAASPAAAPEAPRQLSVAPYAEPAAETVFVALRAADRTPLARVEVVLACDDGSVRRAVTDEAGAARFAPGRGPAQSAVLMEGRPPAVFDVDAEAGRTELLVAEGEVLRGRVTVDGAEPGRPVPLRLLCVRGAGPSSRMSDVLAEAVRPARSYLPTDVVVETAADGTFTAAGLAPSGGRPAFVEPLDRRLEIAAAARPGADEDAARIPRDGSRSVVPAVPVIPLASLPTRTIRVRAADGGPPPSNTAVSAIAWVRIAGAEGGGRAFHAALDPEGAFALPLPRGRTGEGPHAITVDVQPGPGCAVHRFTLPGPNRDTPEAPAEIRLPALRSVRVRVLDADGLPISGAEVSDVGAAPGVAAKTDASGAVDLWLPNAAATLRASAAGFDVAHAAAESGDSRVGFRLSHGGRVQVRVTDASGAGQAGAVVRLLHPWTARPGTWHAADALFERGVGHTDFGLAGVAHEEVATTATADGEGIVALRGIPIGSLVRASIDAGGGRRVAAETTIAPDRQVAMDLRLPTVSHEYVVRAVDAEGRPTAATLVVSETRDGDGVRAKPAGPGGLLRVRNIPWAKAWLTVRGERVTELEERFEAEATDGAAPRIVRIRVGRTLGFTLVDESGEPVPDLMPYLKGGPMRPVLGPTDAPGGFEVLGVGELAPTLVLHRAGSDHEMTLALDSTPQKFVVPSVGGCRIEATGLAADAAEHFVRLERLDVAGPERSEIVVCEDRASKGVAEFEDVAVGRYRAVLGRRIDHRWVPIGRPTDFDVRRNATARIRLGP